MTRIVGGRAKGHRLRVPPSGTRPTSDRAREGVFSSLESLRGLFTDCAVVDLYAGSGALGLEALSRGAAVVDFVESDRAAAAVIRQNLSVVRSALAAPPRQGASGEDLSLLVGVRSMSVRRWLSSATQRYDVVFCDPPYDAPSAEVRSVISALLAADLLAADALVVVERAARDGDWAWPSGLAGVRDLGYGEARLWIGGAPAPDDPSDSVAAC